MHNKLYKRWLTNAYEYYRGEGFTDMTDAEWDFHALKFAKESDKYEELKGTDYEGGSLYWLNNYPEWVIKNDY